MHDTDKNSLKAHVSPTGNIVFYYRNTINGHAHRQSIGKYGSITIYQARRIVTEIEINHGNGTLFISADNSLNNNITFRAEFRIFMDRYSKKEKRSWRDDEREVNLHIKSWLPRKMSSITKYDVQALFEYITDNSGKTQANHILERISAIYNKLIDWGYRLDNPTTGGIRKHKLPKLTRLLLDDELPIFWSGLENYEHTSLPDNVKIALFTGARKCNIFSMRWSDIDW